jgi:FKBP-type peptidyl-prolyl cis-trans isomerase FkpA
MKIINRLHRRGLRAARVVGCVLLTASAVACASAGPATSAPTAASTTSVATPAPRPRPLGPVEQATFAPELDVHLDSMLRHASGLYVQDLRFGNGAVVSRGRSVVVRYAGWLANGKQFDTGEITVALGSGKTIPAWEEGLLGMRAGGQRRIVSPPYMAYGSRGAGSDIPPNAVLVFLMEVTSVF